MANRLMDKIGEVQVGKHVKEAATALVSDVKEITKDTKEAAVEAVDRVREGTKEALHKIEKKL